MSSILSLGPLGIPQNYRLHSALQSGNSQDIQGASALYLAQLAERLAPEQMFVPIYVNGAAGDIIESPPISKPFNGILVSLVSGTLELFFGEVRTGSIADLYFGPVLNPVPVYFPLRQDNKIGVKVSDDSPTDALGSIWVMAY